MAHLTASGNTLLIASLLLLSELGCCFMYSESLPALQKRLDSSAPLKRPSRYWNDDLYPCIEKYCGQYVNANTNMYVRCLSTFCQRGVLTVPARDLDQIEDTNPESVFTDPDKESNDVGNLNQDQIFTLIAFCHRMLCPLDSDQDFSVFWNCAEAKCVPWFNSAWHQKENQIKNGEELTESYKRNEAGSGSRKRVREVRSSTARDSQDQLQINMARCTEERLGEPGCDWKTLYEKKNAPLARKRRINDDVSQCIQSYCGGKNKLDQRMYCIIHHCHRIRSFN